MVDGDLDVTRTVWKKRTLSFQSCHRLRQRLAAPHDSRPRRACILPRTLSTPRSKREYWWVLTGGKVLNSRLVPGHPNFRRATLRWLKTFS